LATLRKSRAIAGLICGTLVVILLAYLLLPYAFLAIGRYHYKKTGDFGTELAALRKKEALVRETGTMPRGVSQEYKRLQNHIKRSRTCAMQAFLHAQALNNASLNDEDLVSLAHVRMRLLVITFPPSYSFSEIEEKLAPIRSHLEEALRLNLKNKEAYCLLIKTYYSLQEQQPEKASEVCDRFGEAFPNDPDMLYWRAMSTDIDDESRIQLLMQIIKKDPAHWATSTLSSLLRKELRFDETIDVLEKWIASNPEPPDMERAKSEMKSVLFYRDAVEKHKSILAENPNDVEAAKALAKILSWDLGANEYAIQWYERAYELDPADKEIIWKLGLIRESLGDTNGAIELYKILLEKATDEYSRESSIADIAEAYLSAGNLDEAFIWYRKLDPESSSSIEFLHLIAEYYQKIGDDEMANKYSNLFIKKYRSKSEQIKWN